MHVALTPGVNNNGTAKASPKLTQNWTQPADATNSITVAAISKGAGNGSSSVTATTVLSVTLTATWTTTDSTNDPAPTSVKVLETSSAYANYTQTGANGAAGTTMVGTVDDGLGQGDTPDANGNISAKTKYATCPVQGGTFTLALAPTASASASPGPSGVDPNTGLSYIGTCTASAGIGPLSFAIHAQPYNYYRLPGQSVKGQNADGSPNGEIDWTYGYSSTDGNTNDLTTCYWHEYVTYPGTVGTIAKPNPYYPQNPPFNYFAPSQFINNPTVLPGAGTSGNLMQAVYDPDPTKDKAEEFDLTLVPALVDPSLYTYGTYTATQLFQFDDTATGETNVTIPGAGSGPYSIVRTVQILDPNDYQYSVTKDSVTNTKLLPK